MAAGFFSRDRASATGVSASDTVGASASRRDIELLSTFGVSCISISSSIASFFGCTGLGELARPSTDTPAGGPFTSGDSRERLAKDVEGDVGSTNGGVSAGSLGERIDGEVVIERGNGGGGIALVSIMPAT